MREARADDAVATVMVGMAWTEWLRGQGRVPIASADQPEVLDGFSAVVTHAREPLLGGIRAPYDREARDGFVREFARVSEGIDRVAKEARVPIARAVSVLEPFARGVLHEVVRPFKSRVAGAIESEHGAMLGYRTTVERLLRSDDVTRDRRIVESIPFLVGGFDRVWGAISASEDTLRRCTHAARQFAQFTFDGFVPPPAKSRPAAAPEDLDVGDPEANVRLGSGRVEPAIAAIRIDEIRFEVPPHGVKRHPMASDRDRSPAGSVYLCHDAATGGVFLASDRKPSRAVFVVAQIAPLDARASGHKASTSVTGMTL